MKVKTGPFVKVLISIIGLTSQILSTSPLHAQNPINVQCGELLVPGAFTKKEELQIYTIALQSEDVLQVIGRAKGTTLFFATRVLDPVDTLVAWSNADAKSYATNTPNLKTDLVSASGIYKVQVFNGHAVFGWSPNNHSPGGRGIGDYTLSFKCIRDGKEVNPNSTPDATKTAPDPAPQDQGATASAFSGYGVGAQASIDFANIESATLTSGEPIKDAIDSNATTPTLYTFDAKAKQTLDLNFKRVSGNVNMGIAVVGPDNKTLFQVSLIASDAFNTKLVLPADGKYTIGVYRVELNPPAKPKATSFELTATVK